MKRVLLDQGLSPATAMQLRSEGWDALHVMELGMDRADDAEILTFALKDSRTCVTLHHIRERPAQAREPRVSGKKHKSR